MCGSRAGARPGGRYSGGGAGPWPLRGFALLRRSVCLARWVGTDSGVGQQLPASPCARWAAGWVHTETNRVTRKRETAVKTRPPGVNMRRGEGASRRCPASSAVQAPQGAVGRAGGARPSAALLAKGGYATVRHRPSPLPVKHGLRRGGEGPGAPGGVAGPPRPSDPSPLARLPVGIHAHPHKKRHPQHPAGATAAGRRVESEGVSARREVGGRPESSSSEGLLGTRLPLAIPEPYSSPCLRANSHGRGRGTAPLATQPTPPLTGSTICPGQTAAAGARARPWGVSHESRLSAQRHVTAGWQPGSLPGR
jgi:hypothetical protein